MAWLTKHKTFFLILYLVFVFGIIIVFTVSTFFIGFFDKPDLQSVLLANLKNNYNIEAKNIELVESENKAEIVVQIYRFSDASGEPGSLAVALISQPNLNKYKLTDFVNLSQKPSANTSGKLLASGYINTYIYDISDQHLKFFDSYSSINWVTTIIVFLIVFAGGVIGSIIKKRQKE